MYFNSGQMVNELLLHCNNLFIAYNYKICSEMSDTQNRITMYHRNLFKVASRQILHTRLWPEKS